VPKAIVMRFAQEQLDQPWESPPVTPGSDLSSLVSDFGEMTASSLDLLNSYVPVFLGAFLVTLLATPLIRRAAIAADVVDHPDDERKTHPYPVAYLGGLAVFFGLIVAIGISYVLLDPTVAQFRSVPLAIVIGMFAITITGFADDVWGWDPRLKIAGQLVAAAALAIEEVGVRVAAGVLMPIFGEELLLFHIPTPAGGIPVDVVYWVGTAIIAMFVLGGCNAANLIDGLDGLLTGVVAVVALGLLLISLLMFSAIGGGAAASADGMAPEASLAGARVVLCVALLGAVLGFLPHNFNPASIFLGDCGSLLLGYMCVVIILMFGEMGHTHLVFAGLIVFALPIIDTMLAIIRRWLAGVPMSSGDDQHIHHQLRRSLGSVKRAVVGLYGISAVFAAVGVILAALVMYTELRVRMIYVIALVLFGCIAVVAVKAARREQLQIRPATKSAPANSARVSDPNVRTAQRQAARTSEHPSAGSHHGASETPQKGVPPSIEASASAGGETSRQG
jgi:UDP-GlcNAc:undecaprenyl-phosphate/decaprenyl-phosphate GlcNAc-1-phosphate transferase